MQVNICRGKADCPAALVAMGNAATHAIGPPEQRFGQHKITFSQGFPDTGTADALLCHVITFHIHHRETVAGPGLLQQCKVAGPVFTKTKIIADHQVFDAKTVEQNNPDKSCGC